MPTVAVLIPWAGECPHRAVALEYVQRWYAERFPEWEVLMGEGSPGAQWCKADAVRSAVRKTRADIFVVADADCYAPKIGEAVTAVSDGYEWAMPHYVVHRLSQKATKEVIEEGTDPTAFTRSIHHYAQMPYAGYAGGGITVVHRDAYAQCPLDPRFVGWGQEDESWAIGMKFLHGPPWRPKHGPLWHLWHPPQQRSSRAVGSSASQALRSAYRKAARSNNMESQLAVPREHIAQAIQL